MKEEMSSLLAGVAGEYFVAAELSKRGYIASITLRNTKGIDIVCSNQEATKTVSIQVKTTRESARTWILDKKAENYRAKNLFYVFVTLNNGKRHPDYFVVPSEIVAKFTSANHKRWLNAPNKSGGKHKDTSMRKFHDENGKYLNKWNRLGL